MRAEAKSFTRQAGDILLHRSGWFSSTLHLTLIGMLLITGYALTLSQEQRSTNFALYGGFIVALLSAYATKRYSESKLTQSNPAPSVSVAVQTTEPAPEKTE